MVTTREAESTLKTIRVLMERATIYRAISSPTALVAGLLALVLPPLARLVPVAWVGDPVLFVAAWTLVGGIVCAFNMILIYRGARQRNEPFFSPGMKLAARGIVPSLTAGGAVTVLALLRGPVIPELVTLWNLFYGLALLSTQEFAPRSIRWLGLAFVASGIVTGLVWALGPFRQGWQFGWCAMQGTFGLLHIFYVAALLWTQSNNPVSTEEPAI